MATKRKIGYDGSNHNDEAYQLSQSAAVIRVKQKVLQGATMQVCDEVCRLNCGAAMIRAKQSLKGAARTAVM